MARLPLNSDHILIDRSQKAARAMTEIILIIHLLIALGLIGTVLMQRSEGGALGIGGGGGGGGGMFTARGAGNALTRTTAILALGFFITSISLTILATRTTTPTSVFDSVPATTQPAEKTPLPTLPPAPKDPTKPQVPTGQ